MLDEDVLKKLGFDGEEEFNKMVCDVDLTKQNIFAAFKVWQLSDGSKAGLQKVIDLK